MHIAYGDHSMNPVAGAALERRALLRLHESLDMTAVVEIEGQKMPAAPVNYELNRFLRTGGYYSVREVKPGVLVGLHDYLFTTGLVVGLTLQGYETRYCYARRGEAMVALKNWDGTGDPGGPWIKRKGADGEALGPGAY